MTTASQNKQLEHKGRVGSTSHGSKVGLRLASVNTQAGPDDGGGSGIEGGA